MQKDDDKPLEEIPFDHKGFLGFILTLIPFAIAVSYFITFYFIDWLAAIGYYLHFVLLRD
jgi:hypothetical protein